MAKKKIEFDDGLWSGISDQDFLNEDNIDDSDIAEFSNESMALFSANINLVRHIVRLTDSLKPVERRILYAMYKVKAIPGRNLKSADIISAAMKYHHHGDGPIYKAMINMAQYWKKSLPMITGKSNLGSIVEPDGYAAYRYSETRLTEYAYECFFEDYNDRAVMMDKQLTGVEEPKYIPSKFPNALVNGTDGIGYGFAAIIPPFNCNDIVDMIKALIDNPDMDDPVIYPDLPTGCDIVFKEGNIEDICKTGKGSLRMRARIDIVERPETWALEITSIPYTVPYDKIVDSLVELKKSGKLEIKDIQDDSRPYKSKDGKIKHDIMIRVILPKALDPKAARSIIFKNTNLEKTLALQFYVIKGDRDIDIVSLKELGLAWINERRLYKRSLFNHKIAALHAAIDMLEIKINLCSKDNAEKTISIIKRNNKADAAKALMKEFGINSHQAKICVDMGLSEFSKDSLEKFKRDLKDNKEKIINLEKIARSPKKIDNIIKEEIEDLRKYATPRKSPIIKIDNETTISNSDHIIMISGNGNIKKLPYPTPKVRAKAPYGAFEQGDYPDHVFRANNLDSLMLMDSNGRYSVMPISKIPNTLYQNTGENLFNLCKIGPRIVFNLPISNKDIPTGAKKKKLASGKFNKFSLISLSTDGVMKKTPIADYLTDSNGEFVNSVKGTKGAKTKTSIIQASTWFDDVDSQLLVFTKKGGYVLINPNDIPSTGRDTIGVSTISLRDGDECAGYGAVNLIDDTHVIVATAKGNVKLIETEFMHISKKRKDASYIARVDDNDEIIFAAGCVLSDVLHIESKMGSRDINVSDIPIMGRMAKPHKMVPVPQGDKIIHYSVSARSSE